jgi:AraC-like DNA-binding protein
VNHETFVLFNNNYLVFLPGINFYPDTELQPFVSRYHVIKIERPADMVWRHSHMPTAQNAIVFNFFEKPMTTNHTGGSALTRSYFVGQLTRGCTKTLEGSLHLLIVDLKPLAFNALFRIPMNTLVDKVTDLESMIGAPGKYVTEQIFTASTMEERITIINNFLLSQLRKSSQKAVTGINHAIALIYKSAGNISITDLAAGSHTTERTLRRYFEEQVGLNPKFYSRILRFTKVVGLIENGAMKTWRDIPLDYGYVDQSHFIKDFKLFSGTTPTEYYPDDNQIHQLFSTY